MMSAFVAPHLHCKGSQGGAMPDGLSILSDLKLGDPIHWGPLSIVPLIGDQPGAGKYLTLDEALRAGVLDITEISDAGTVPELLLRNRAETPVLLLDGEELV